MDDPTETAPRHAARDWFCRPIYGADGDGQMAGKQGIAKSNVEGQGAPYCSADDLKGVLASIAGQIADADRRHTATLATMQERLLQLGREAEAVRALVPGDLAQDFARVEAGMANLTDRIAAASHESGATETRLAGVDQPAAVSMAPAPLRSALPTTATLGAGESVRGGASQPDPFEFAAHSVAADPSDPWDERSAEALVKLYDSGEAAFAKQEPPVEATPALVIHLAAEPIVVPTPTLAPLAGSAPAAEAHADRDWLDQRFAEIAERVEKSLADLKPDGAIAALDRRFNEFEHRVDAALEGLATHADVGGIRIIEAHISELSSHIEHAQSQFARLEGIEAQLNALGQRLSDDNLAELLAASAPTAQDYSLIADAVSAQLGPRLASTAPASAQPDHRNDELRTLIERFVGDQRQGEEHTMSMLDTMQQAMIRMLDRMDSLEHTQAVAPRHDAGAPMYAASSFAPAHAPAKRDAPMAPREPDLGSFRAGPERIAERNEPVVAEPAMPAGPAASFAARTKPQPAFAEAPAEFPDAMEGAVPAAPEMRPQPRSREDFVAAARRAMRQAASESTASSMDEPVNEPIEISPTAKIPAAKSTARAKHSGGLQPRLVAGLIALLAIGGALAAFNKFRSPSAAPSAKVERRLLTPETEAAEKQAKIPGLDAGSRALATDAEPAAEPKMVQPQTPTRPQPQSKHGPATEPHVAPGPKPKLRPEPESMVDELSEADPLPETVAPAAPPAVHPARVVSEPLRGITVQQPSRLPTAEELIRAQHQHRLATLSNKLGASQPVAAASPAALIPGIEPTAPAAPVGTAAATTADMPPATIGPNSLRLAAANGDPSAEFEVAARFAEGKGVQQDFKQAITWYNRAAGKGFAAAQYRLGTLYERGLGTKADLARAKVWYQRAAELGSVKAMHNLAVLSAGRDQGTPDYTAAAHWFQAAAERGLADSQYNLAVLHESGLGVPRDPKAAYMWLSLAVKNGDKDAAKRRDQVKQSLDAASLKSAGEMVEQWQPKPTDLMANDARAAGEAWKARHAIQPQG